MPTDCILAVQVSDAFKLQLCIFSQNIILVMKTSCVLMTNQYLSDLPKNMTINFDLTFKYWSLILQLRE
jgi:hypothetical protein